MTVADHCHSFLTPSLSRCCREPSDRDRERQPEKMTVFAAKYLKPDKKQQTRRFSMIYADKLLLEMNVIT